jgi:hypothetical protein
MAVHESANQRAAQPDAQEDLLAPQSATQSMTLPQQDESLVQRESPTQGKQGEQRLAGDAEHVGRATVLVAGGAILVAVAIFGAGFMRTPIEQALRRLRDRIAIVDLPLVLPITIAETVRELRTDSRIMSEMRAVQRAV